MTTRTTLILSDQLIRELKRQAALRGATPSDVVEGALRRGLAATPTRELPPLPMHRMGPSAVDLADRDRLYRAMEED